MTEQTKRINNYATAIEYSLLLNKTDVELHLIEEMAELTVELCKKKRNKEENIISEMSDTYFQMVKYISKNDITFEDLMDHAIEKTRVLYPQLLLDV